MSASLFSIITVTYNAATTLPFTLESVRRQSWRDYEMLIVDGASTDGTLELTQDTGIENLKVVSRRDSGIYDAMNRGLDMAQGRYCIFLNAGDAFHSDDTLQRIAETIEANDYPQIVYGQTQIVDNNRRRIGDRHHTAPDNLTWEDFSRGMLVCHQAFVADTDITPRYNLHYRFSADYEWCIRCLQQSKRNVLIDDVLIDYLSEGVTTKNRRASLIERYKIMCRYYGTLPTILRHVGFVFRLLFKTLKSK